MTNILAPMARLGRNSMLTNKLAVTLKEKLNEVELRQFNEWLRVVEQDKELAVRSAKRKTQF